MYEMRIIVVAAPVTDSSGGGGEEEEERGRRLEHVNGHYSKNNPVIHI